MTITIRTILTIVFSCALLMLFAQKPKPAAQKPETFKKFTPPKLISMLGIRSDTATVVIEEAVQLVKLPLKVTDDKKGVYSISSYRTMYRRRGVTENEETGKVSPIMSQVSDIFTETPLPDRWKNILVQQLRSGEELFFYDIVAKDAEGRLMYAPVILIKVK